jgi:RimJ/RimL family protein N-acetyltransferase
MQRTTARLTLRPPRQADLSRLFAIYSDPATNQFNPAGPFTGIEQAQALLDHWLQHWNLNGSGPWAIARQVAADDIIGFGGLSLHPYVDVEHLNLGYRFAASTWGQGYATELSEAALQHAFIEQHAPQVFALVRPQHAASIRVLEKVGMQRVATLDDVQGQPASLVFRVDQPISRV